MVSLPRLAMGGHYPTDRGPSRRIEMPKRPSTGWFRPATTSHPGPTLHLCLEGLEGQRASDLARVVPSDTATDREQHSTCADRLPDDNRRLVPGLPHQVTDYKSILVIRAVQTDVRLAVCRDFTSQSVYQ